MSKERLGFEPVDIDVPELGMANDIDPLKRTVLESSERLYIEGDGFHSEHRLLTMKDKIEVVRFPLRHDLGVVSVWSQLEGATTLRGGGIVQRTSNMIGADPGQSVGIQGKGLLSTERDRKIPASAVLSTLTPHLDLVPDNVDKGFSPLRDIPELLIGLHEHLKLLTLPITEARQAHSYEAPDKEIEDVRTVFESWEGADPGATAIELRRTLMTQLLEGQLTANEVYSYANARLRQLAPKSNR